MRKLLNPDDPEFKIPERPLSQEKPKTPSSTAAEQGSLALQRRATFLRGSGRAGVGRKSTRRQLQARAACRSRRTLQSQRPLRVGRYRRGLRLQWPTSLSCPRRTCETRCSKKLIATAMTEGRNIEKLAQHGFLRSQDMERMSPRTRSAVQRLRGDATTDWMQKRALEDAEKARIAEERAGKYQRRKSRMSMVHQGSAMGASLLNPGGGSGNPDDPNGGANDGSTVSLTVDIVTNLLMLAPLTKIQGATTVWSLILHGLGPGSRIYTTLNAGAEGRCHPGGMGGQVWQVEPVNPAQDEAAGATVANQGCGWH